MSESVAAVIPDRLSRLPELANDLWWSWNVSAREVFRRLVERCCLMKSKVKNLKSSTYVGKMQTRSEVRSVR